MRCPIWTLTGGAARLHRAVGYHQADDLADVLHRALGKDGFVVHEGGKQPVTRNVRAQHQAAHAGHLQGFRGINCQQRAVGDGGQDGRGMQRAFELGHVVNVGSGAGDVSHGGFMGPGCSVCRVFKRFLRRVPPRQPSPGREGS